MIYWIDNVLIILAGGGIGVIGTFILAFSCYRIPSKMNRSCRRPSPKTRRLPPSTTGCPTGRIVFFLGLAFRPINQPFCARSRPGFCAPEYVRSTTESKPMPSFVAGRVLTNTTCPDSGKRLTPRKNYDNGTRSRPEKTQSPRF